jgi:hypothetical protein
MSRGNESTPSLARLRKSPIVALRLSKSKVEFIKQFLKEVIFSLLIVVALKLNKIVNIFNKFIRTATRTAL